jgi:hypothetical protein
MDQFKVTQINLKFLGGQDFQGYLPDRARIIEFGSKVRWAGLQHLVVAF